MTSLEPLCLLRHSYQQEHVVLSQQISMVEAFFQNMNKRCDWLRISRANLFWLLRTVFTLQGVEKYKLWDLVGSK